MLDLRAPSFLVDIDGTLISGSCALPGAIDFVAAVRERIVLISNNAEHTPSQMARLLRRIGLPVPADRIILAGTSALEIIAQEHPQCRLMFLGSRSLMSYARYLGLRLTTQEPDIVLLARDRRFNYAKLMGAANAIRGGAELVVANPDLTHPGIAGRIVPETGSLLQAILACTGPLPYRVIGKPEAELFRRALARCGATSAIVIGDNPATDGAGADRLGLPFFPVEGGVNRALSALIAA